MDPLTISLIGGGIAGGLGLWGGHQQQTAQRREAARNRRFQERMRDTAWQAAVTDMQAAGINPAVAYSRGPAAAPGGSMAGQDNIVGSSVSNAMQAVRMKKELELLDRQIESAAATAQKTQQEKILTEWQNRLMGTFTAQGFRPGPSWNLAEANASISQNNARLRMLEIPMMENLASIAGTPAGKMGAWLQYILRSIGR